MGSLGGCSFLTLLMLLLSIQGSWSARAPGSDFYPDIPPLKTFQSEYGDQIDCVNIYSQPAFAHSLLKNHKIQNLSLVTHPMHTLKGARSDFKSVTSMSSFRNGTCPEGTVPILRGPISPNVVHKQGASLNQNNPQGHEYASLSISGSEYQGSAAYLNIWNPLVEGSGEFSSARIRVANAANAIEVGWHVYPNIYNGDNQTRLFIYWTSDGNATGCYNLLCPGFVQVSKKLAPGVVLPSSDHNGTQYALPLAVVRDPEAGNWLVVLGNETVGYWPRALFTALADGATSVEWGGEVLNQGQASHTATQMGSGQFPSEGGLGVSAFFGNLLYLNGEYNVTMPDGVTPIVSRPKCYDIKDNGDGGQDLGYIFFFGGPGRNDICT